VRSKLFSLVLGAGAMNGTETLERKSDQHSLGIRENIANIESHGDRIQHLEGTLFEFTQKDDVATAPTATAASLDSLFAQGRNRKDASGVSDSKVVASSGDPGFCDFG
jgi:hypothetical protein